LVLLLFFYLLFRFGIRHLFAEVDHLFRMLEMRNRKLEKMTQTDFLTKTLNRKTFRKMLGSEVQRARRYGHPLSLIFFDIDNFKKINDTYGHKVGDKVLKEVSALVGDGVRENDALCRWGGEEFLLLLPETGRPTALEVAEKLRKAVEAHPIPEAGGGVTCSFGVAQLEGEEHPEQFVNRADMSMYQAKQSGKNKVCC